jgi:hypothetical protein
MLFSSEFLKPRTLLEMSESPNDHSSCNTHARDDYAEGNHEQMSCQEQRDQDTGHVDARL